MQNNGYLIISLDFELIWGVFDVVEYHEGSRYFQNTKDVIPKILDLFQEHDIHCTWATVGMLFNKDWQDWLQNIPEQIPQYVNQRLSAYSFGNKKRSRDSGEFCFASNLVKKIKNTSGQEIGTHTYSHYYSQESHQTIGQFEADLKKAIELAANFEIPIKSLVFPRNQLNREYLEVCASLGIETVRSNPDVWYWKDPSMESLAIKLFRTADAYNIFTKKKSYPLSDLKKENNLPLNQKASRFLRPFEGNAFLHTLKIIRIKSEMTKAAKLGEIYHLWWHPHNFGEHPKESLKDLSEIIRHFKILQKKYGFQSENMQGLYQVFLKNT